MKNKINTIILFLGFIILIQSTFVGTVSAATLSIKYEAKFKLGTMYKYNVLIKSFFKFKMEVMDDESVKFSADGKYRDLGYVWSDRYDVKIYDKKGNERANTTLSDWTDVYTGAQNFINFLNSANIKVGETLEIKSKLWGDTMQFPWDTLKYYQKSPMSDYMDGKLLSFLITDDGIIQNTPKVKVLEKDSYKASFTLRVKNNNTGNEENRTVNIKSDSSIDPDIGVKRYWLTMDDKDFGVTTGYSWADNYIILGENDDSIINKGVYLRKGDKVSEGIKELISAFKYFSTTVQGEYKLTFQSDNNTIRLYDKNGDNPCIFTNKNQNFELPWKCNRITFYDTKYGLMEQ